MRPSSAAELLPDPRARRASLLLGIVLAAMGMVGVAAWGLARPGLVQPIATFPPLSLVEALGVTSAGLGLVGLATSSRRALGLTGLLTFGLGAATLLQRLVSSGLSGGAPPLAAPLPVPVTLPVSSALLFCFGGAGLLALVLPSRADRSRLTAGALGAVEVVLCLGILVARIVWTPDVQGGLLVGSSLQLLVATLLLGLCLGLTAWSANPATIAEAWVPLSVGIACLVTVTFLWRALVAYEQEQLRERTEAAARSARQQILRQVESATRAISRIARFSPAPWPRSSDRTNTVVALTRDIDGLRGLAWTGADARVDQLLPTTIDDDSLRADLARRLSAEIADDSARAWQLTTYFPLSEPGTFAISMPTCGAERCTGHVLGLFDAAGMLAPLLNDSTQGFLHAVTADRRDIIAPPGRLAPPVDWTSRASVSLGRVVWDLSTWPSDRTVARLRSGLPDLLLLLGLLVSALLPLTIRLGQLNWTRARMAERVRLNLALETATDGIWEWDVASGVALRSAALWRHLGYDPAMMERERDAWSELVHPADQKSVSAAMAGHLAGLTPTFEARYRVRDQSGDWHWVIDRGRVVERSATGQPRRVLGISADITDRTRADEARDASERRFRACFDSADQLQLLLDREGRVLEANRAALDFTGLPLESLRGQPLWTLSCWIGPEDPAGRIRSDVAAALAGRTVRRELTLDSQREEHQHLFLACSLSPILDGSGAVTQLLAEGRDITERKRAGDILREVESLTTMGRLAARVAHEINNPLAGIQNAFLLIRDAVPASHPHQKYVGAVEREISRIAGVTRQLYETYRPEANGSHDTSLPSLVGDAVALLEQANRATGVRIQVDLSRAPATVRLPDAILRSALYNLVQNAVEASPPGAEVQLCAAVEDGVFVLRVLDRGPGIPDEIRERVFEPFFTTKAATVRTGGMGLGLSLVRRSVQALGGLVEIHDRPGGGTEFVVRLPLTPLSPGELS